MSEESNYPTPRIPAEARRLLTMAGLPLVDGFFLAFLLTGLWQEPGQALAFGLTAFSGAACFVAAMQLPGTWRQRLGWVIGVYALIGLAALLIAAAQPFFASILPENLHLFTGLFLIGLGLWISEVPSLRRVAGWLGFEAAVKVMVAASLIHGALRGPVWQLSLNPAVLGPLALAVAAGFALSALGMLLGLALSRATDQRPLNWGAGISLVLMGLKVLGVPAPSSLVIAPLAVGCLATVALAIQQVPGRWPPISSEQPQS